MRHRQRKRAAAAGDRTFPTIRGLRDGRPHDRSHDRFLCCAAASLVSRDHVHRTRASPLAGRHDACTGRGVPVHRAARMARVRGHRHRTDRRWMPYLGNRPKVRRLTRSQGLPMNARSANRGNDRHGAWQERLAVRQQGRRLKVSGVLGGSACGAIFDRRRCVGLAAVAIPYSSPCSDKLIMKPARQS
jgi:hypothetical protein